MAQQFCQPGREPTPRRPGPIRSSCTPTTSLLSAPRPQRYPTTTAKSRSTIHAEHKDIVALVSMAAAAVAVSTSLCGSGHQSPRPSPRTRTQSHRHPALPARRRQLLQTTALAAARKTPGEAEEQMPAWARPGADEPPPWAREGGGSAREPGASQVPFYAYLLASAVTAIAAIGSIFEYTSQRPVFGIINSDSALYAPLLGFFVFTGIPTSGFLWFKAVQTANKEAEEQDRRDGFM